MPIGRMQLPRELKSNGGILDAWARHATASELMDLKGVGSHELKGYDFAQNFPALVPGKVHTPVSWVGPMLAKGYQYGQELGRSILDGPGNYTMGQAWKEAGKQSDANIQGMLGKGVNRNMYDDFISTYGIDNIRSNIGSAEASIPTRDDMIKAGIVKQMLKEGTATPMARRTYGNMSMGQGKPDWVADRSPVSQGLKEIEIGMAPFVANRIPSQQDLASDFFINSIKKDSKFYDPYKPTFKDQIKKGYSKYAKPVMGGIMSALSGIPGVGLLMNAFQKDPYAQNRIDMYGAYRDPSTGFMKDKFGYNVGQTLFKNRFLEPGSNSYRSYALDAMRGMDKAGKKGALDNYYQQTYGKTWDQVKKDHQQKKDPFNNTNPFAGTADNFAGAADTSFDTGQPNTGGVKGSSYSRGDYGGKGHHWAKGGIVSLWRR